MSIFSLLAQAESTAQTCNPGEAGVNLGNCLVLNPDNPGQSVGDVYSSPAVLIDVVIKNLFPIAGLILLVIILYAGFKFIYQGTKGKDEAKQIIETAIIGFVIMFAAYWVIQIVRIVTGIDTLGI